MLQVTLLRQAAQSWLLVVERVPVLVLLALLLQAQLEEPLPVLMLALVPRLMLGLL